MLSVYKVFDKKQREDRRRNDVRTSLDGRTGTIEQRLDSVKNEVIERLLVSYF